MNLSNVWRWVPWPYARHLKLSLDVTLWALAMPVAAWLRIDASPGAALGGTALFVLAILPVQALIVYGLGLHRQSWGVASANDVRNLVAGVGLGSLLTFGIAWSFQPVFGVPRSVPLIAGALAIVGMGGMRLGTRWLRERHPRTGPAGARRVIILGAGDAGSMLAREAFRHPELGITPVAFLDDDPARLRLSHMGIPIVGPLRSLPEAFKEYKAHEALFAIPSAPIGVRRAIFELAESARVPLRYVPSFSHILATRTPGQMHDAFHSFVLEARPRNVLIIGGAGYIGSALVPQLLERGYHVRVLDALIYGREPIAAYMSHPRFELIEGDFRQIHHVVQAMQGIDTVIHLGALVGDPACALDEDLTIEINLMATKMIAEVAKGYGVSRFIFASTCSVYGASDDVLDESSPLNPVSLYARTKIASEKVLLKMADASFAPTILRFGTVYGFSGRTRFDLVVNTLTAKAVVEKLITVYGGDQWRPFIHVHDVAKAVLITAESSSTRTRGRIFNVGSDAQNYTLMQAAEIVNKVVPDATVKDFGQNADRRNYRVSFRSIQEELGFQPSWTLEDGVRQVAEALRSGKVADYKSPIYSNVAFLTDEGLSKLSRGEFSSVLTVLEEPPDRVLDQKAAQSIRR